MGQKIIQLAEKHRILISRVLVTFIIALCIISRHSWEEDSYIILFFEALGLILIGVCTLGRLWTSMYISGYKTHNLIQEGPYSVVRNPLYFFSFLGATGLGFSSENILVLGLIVSLFAIYYPFVILAEEQEMVKIHGEEYIKYMERVPRFIPKLSLFKEPELYIVKAKKYRKTFFDAMWFIWFYMLLQIVERFQEIGLLPVIFRVP